MTTNLNKSIMYKDGMNLLFEQTVIEDEFEKELSLYENKKTGYIL